MTLEVYGHPFSSYCQKVFIALYENATPFDFRTIDPDHPENAVEWARLWPLKRFPLLVDNGRPVMEATVIIEHLGLHYPGPVELRSEEHTSELQSLMRISYAVFGLKKTTNVLAY